MAHRRFDLILALRRIALPAVALAALVVVPSAIADGASTRHYYLALGDSLSRGMQPNVQGVTEATKQGYVNRLWATERHRIHRLRLVQLGCGGETTGSMITGQGNKYKAFYHCHPAGGSQLAAAVRFLKHHHHRGEVPLLTLDIGANDIDSCASSPNVVQCVAAGQAQINKNMPTILSALRHAAPRGTRFAAMTLYDPVLGQYFSSNPSQRGLALASPAFLKAINSDLSNAYAKYRFRNADVGSAFDSYDGTTTVAWMGQQIPINVARVCAWTWACATPPSGPNIHANKNGYAVMADTFAHVIGRLRVH